MFVRYVLQKEKKNNKWLTKKLKKTRKIQCLFYCRVIMCPRWRVPTNMIWSNYWFETFKIWFFFLSVSVWGKFIIIIVVDIIIVIARLCFYPHSRNWKKKKNKITLSTENASYLNIVFFFFFFNYDRNARQTSKSIMWLRLQLNMAIVYSMFRSSVSIKRWRVLGDAFLFIHCHRILTI